MNDTTMPSWTPQTEAPKDSSTTTAEPPAPRKRTRKPTPSAAAPKIAANVAAPRKRAAKKKAAPKKPTAGKRLVKAAKQARAVARDKAHSARAKADINAIVLATAGLSPDEARMFLTIHKGLGDFSAKSRPKIVMALAKLFCA